MNRVMLLSEVFNHLACSDGMYRVYIGMYLRVDDQVVVFKVLRWREKRRRIKEKKLNFREMVVGI